MIVRPSRLGLLLLLLQVVLILAAVSLTRWTRLSCEQAVDVYADEIRHHDFDGLVDMVAPKDRSRYGDIRLHKMFVEEYGAVEEFRFKSQQPSQAEGSDRCEVKTRADYTLTSHWAPPKSVSDVEDYPTFQHIGYSWYLTIPNSQSDIGF